MSVNDIECDGDRLLARLRELGGVGCDASGKLSRLAASDSDQAGRDWLVMQFKEAGLEVTVDRIGNIFGTYNADSNMDPLMMGSHIDSVVNAGMYDGSYGVLAGLSVVEACCENNLTLDRPLVVGAFTNEEGVRFSPDMMGSLVYAGGLDVDEALATVGVDGTVLGEELERIGYAGTMQPGQITPSLFLEVHIEQGPVLEAEGISIGAVENLQGISWQKVSITGVANHAGTTPTRLRHDAGLAAAKIVTFLRDLVEGSNSVATVGSIRFEPNVINVIPSFAELTVDLRDPNKERLRELENSLEDFLQRMGASDGVTIGTEQLVNFDPVQFDASIVDQIKQVCSRKELSYRIMTSGAGHDAQMMARICPSAMIFVPSQNGISHNPREHTDPQELIAGANVLLETVLALTSSDPES
jgi:N-carbamoyl-L-amino-acid hydrolase